MLARIAQHVAVPELLLVAELKLPHAVRPRVLEPRRRTIHDLCARLPQALAKVHIFKPHREELGVHAFRCVPRGTRDGQARSGRLLDLLFLRVVRVKATVTPVHRISRPQLVDQQHLEQQARERGKSPERKSSGGLPIAAQESAAGGGCPRTRHALQQRIHCAGFGNRIRIQDQQHVAAGCARSVIYAARKSDIARNGDELQRNLCRQGLHSRHRVVLRRVVHHDDLAILRRQRRRHASMWAAEL